MGHLVDGGDALDVLEDGLHAEFGERRQNRHGGGQQKVLHRGVLVRLEMMCDFGLLERDTRDAVVDDELLGWGESGEELGLEVLRELLRKRQVNRAERVERCV